MPASVAVSFRLPYDKHLEFTEEAKYHENMSALIISKLESCERAEEIFREKDEENEKLKKQVKELQERLAKTIGKRDEATTDCANLQSELGKLEKRNTDIKALNEQLQRLCDGLQKDKDGLAKSLKETTEKYLEAKQRLACIHEIISPKHEKKAIFTSKTFHKEVVESLWKFSKLNLATKATREGKTIHFKPLE